jgi:hypothetical protein
MKRYGLAVLIAGILIMGLAVPVLAISNPDSAPLVAEKIVFRNLLETGDMLILVKEDVPYATPPTDYSYDDAYVWQLYDTTDTYEIAQTSGYNYNDNGYNENVIGFYFSADDAPDWGEAYYLKLAQTPAAFPTTQQVWQFPLEAGEYSDITDQDEALHAVSDKVIEWADDLNSEWGLTGTDLLTMPGELGTVLSYEGQTFFRGAIYGIQALAPYAFDVQIFEVNTEPRTWSTEYSSNVSASFNGTYIGDAADAGNEMLGITGYNLFGLLGCLAMCGGFAFASIRVGGDIWGTMIFTSGILVICGRLAMIGLGELGLLAAVMWIWISGKVWKVW